jgi:histidinol-phosphate aminotransferase
VDLLPEFGNLVVLRTFSKALGSAGIRIGYLLGHPPLVTEIMKGKIPFDINLFSHTAATHVLGRADLVEDRVRVILSERDRIAERLEGMAGVTPYPSKANFILFQVESPAAVFSGLVERGVLIRDMTGYPMLGKALRVSVGAPEENDQFLKALGDSLPQTSG